MEPHSNSLSDSLRSLAGSPEPVASAPAPAVPAYVDDVDVMPDYFPGDEEGDVEPADIAPTAGPPAEDTEAEEATEVVRITRTRSNDLYSYIADRGFFFSREVVSRYLLSLKSKPFVIFNGISGTGKTKLALLTAEYFARVPGTAAQRIEQPEDNEHSFFLRISETTMRSGNLQVAPHQFDYFNTEPGMGKTITVNITNILGAQGDITFRLNSVVNGHGQSLSVSVPVSARRAFEQTGVQVGDYLNFEIVEEFKRFRVSLYRPERQTVEEPPQNRFAFVGVRPNWHDHSSLLGYYDLGLDEYVRTPILELLLRAQREYEEAMRLGRTPAPYFLILDEMNLAKIEYYFADFLSAIESRRVDADGTLAQETMPLHDRIGQSVTWKDEQGVIYEIPTNMPIPPNLLFTGTVNDDETTHNISPKVLDRANVMEFIAVDFEAYLRGDFNEGDSPFELPAPTTAMLDLGELELGNQAEARELSEFLKPLLQINDELAPFNRHFGFRALNEIAHFVVNTQKFIGEDADTMLAALDVQIAQKVLTKLYGIRDGDQLVARLLWLCATGQPAPEDTEVDVDHLRSAIRLTQDDMALANANLLPISSSPGATTDDGFAYAHFPRSAAQLYRALPGRLQTARSVPARPRRAAA